MSKKLKLFILASIILNIVLIGIVAGHSYHRYGMHRDNQIITLLDKSSIALEKQQVIRKKLKDSFHNKKQHTEKKKWREETIAILTAEELDIVAYRKQLEQMVAKHHDNKKQRIEAIISLVSELSQEERVNLAKIFKKSRR